MSELYLKRLQRVYWLPILASGAFCLAPIYRTIHYKVKSRRATCVRYGFYCHTGLWRLGVRRRGKLKSSLVSKLHLATPTGFRLYSFYICVVCDKIR